MSNPDRQIQLTARQLGAMLVEFRVHGTLSPVACDALLPPMDEGAELSLMDLIEVKTEQRVEMVSEDARNLVRLMGIDMDAKARADVELQSLCSEYTDYVRRYVQQASRPKHIAADDDEVKQSDQEDENVSGYKGEYRVKFRVDVFNGQRTWDVEVGNSNNVHVHVDIRVTTRQPVNSYLRHPDGNLYIQPAQLPGSVVLCQTNGKWHHVDEVPTVVLAPVVDSFWAGVDEALVDKYHKMFDGQSQLNRDAIINIGVDDGRLAKALQAKALDTNTMLNFDPSLVRSVLDENGRAIAKALETNTTLTALDLSGKNIGDEGGRAIAKALKTNKTLTILNLSGNGIGDEGGRAIANALKTNKTLTILNLSCNGIGDEGGRAIANALESNKTLTGLNLGQNCISDECALVLTKALETNQTLTLRSHLNSQRF